MALLSAFDPFFGSEFRRLQRQMDGMFSDFERNVTTGGGQQPEARNWAPRCDVKEVDGQIQVHAELPGVTKDNINVVLDRGILTISGERKYEKKEENEKWHRVERSYGSFSRSFQVGDNINPDDIKASFKDGVLEVSLPAPHTVKPQVKQITVQ